MTTILSIVGALVGLYMFSIYSNKKICRKLFVENYFAEEQESLEAAAEMANRPVFPSLNVASITNARSFLRVNPDAAVKLELRKTAASDPMQTVRSTGHIKDASISVSHGLTVDQSHG